MDWQLLITSLIPVIAGALTSLAMTGLRKVSAWVDAQAAWIKQLIVVLIAFGVTQLGALLGLELPTNALLWDGTIVETVITALLAFGVYNIFPKKDDTTV